MPTEIRRLFEHLAWADRLLLECLSAIPTPPGEVLREYAHILGADEVWLSRIEQRVRKAPVWPELSLEEIRQLASKVHAGYDGLLGTLDDAGLAREVSYTNSAGESYQNSLREILLHVVLHAHYHRGKINLLLRQSGMIPAPADYIGFVRGSPAATVGDPRRTDKR